MESQMGYQRVRDEHRKIQAIKRVIIYRNPTRAQKPTKELINLQHNDNECFM